MGHCGLVPFLFTLLPGRGDNMTAGFLLKRSSFTGPLLYILCHDGKISLCCKPELNLRSSNWFLTGYFVTTTIKTKRVFIENGLQSRKHMKNLGMEEARIRITDESSCLWWIGWHKMWIKELNWEDFPGCSVLVNFRKVSRLPFPWMGRIQECHAS